MRVKGLEPPLPKERGPKPRASTSSATPAQNNILYITIFKRKFLKCKRACPALNEQSEYSAGSTSSATPAQNNTPY